MNVLVAALALVSCLAGSVPAPAGQASAAPPARQEVRTHYLVLFDLGPKYDRALTPFQQPGIAEHGAYMSQLVKEGKLLVGGPFVDKPGSLTATGAVMVIAADSLEQARQIVEADPAGKSGLLSVTEIKPVVVVAGAWVK